MAAADCLLGAVVLQVNALTISSNSSFSSCLETLENRRSGQHQRRFPRPKRSQPPRHSFLRSSSIRV